VLLFGLYGASAALFMLQELWWCKQAATIVVLLAYLKAAQFCQASPGLGRLVQVRFIPIVVGTALK
jgi:hypothetical protein